MDDCFNPYFIGLPILILVKIIKEGMPFQIVSILILLDYLFLLVDLGNMLKSLERSLNPYFIGLPILIIKANEVKKPNILSQSLFYWITYSYKQK